MRLRSQVVQRDYPRPTEINATVLRPKGAGDQQLTELQRAEELIKREMVTMMHYDALHNPTLAQQGIAPGKKTQQQKAVISQAQHAAYLGSNPYEKFKEGDLEKVNIGLNRISYSMIPLFA